MIAAVIVFFAVAEVGDDKDVKQEPVAGDLRVVSSVVTLLCSIDSLNHEHHTSAFHKFLSYCVFLIVAYIWHIDAQILPSPRTTRVLGK